MSTTGAAAMTHYHPTHLAARNCYRCGKDLTDPASLEEGVGPICRKLDNAVLARLMPVDVEAVKYEIAAIVQGVGTTGHDLTEIQGALDFLAHGLNNSEVIAAHNGDFRKEVKRIEWILSHYCPGWLKVRLQNLTAFLGYSALVALWKGEAATSKAEVWFGCPAGGTAESILGWQLCIKGTRSKMGQWKIKQTVGWGYNATNKTWYVKADQADKFAQIVKTYWPNHDPAAMIDALHAAEEFAKKSANQAPKSLPADVKDKAAALGFDVEGIESAMGHGPAAVGFKFECTTCKSLYFPTPEALENHTKTTHAPKTGPDYACDECGAPDNQGITHAEHCSLNPVNEVDELHSGDSEHVNKVLESLSGTAETFADIPCVCGKCGQTFPNTLVLSQHYCPSVETFVCKMCACLFPTSAELLKHQLLAGHKSLCTVVSKTFLPCLKLEGHDGAHGFETPAMTPSLPPGCSIAEISIDTYMPGEKSLIVTTPYNKAFVAALKEWLPQEDRKWVSYPGLISAWVIKAKHRAEVEKWIAQYYKK